MGLPQGSKAVKVVPGKLLLKGGVPLVQKEESAAKREKRLRRAAVAAAAAEAEEAAGGAAGGGAAAGIGGAVGKAPSQTYEQLFPAEVARATEGKGRTAAWGTNYRAAPEILHGYSAPLTGKLTVEQALDKRAAQKADKYCR